MAVLETAIQLMLMLFYLAFVVYHNTKIKTYSVKSTLIFNTEQPSRGWKWYGSEPSFNL